MNTIKLKGPHVGFSGEYRAILRNPDESVAYDSGWQDNLITTRGEFLYGTRGGSGGWDNGCYIGSSAAAPQYSDTTMGAFLAYSTNDIGDNPSGSSFNGGNPDYQRWTTRTYRFAAGVGTGTVREMGLGNADPTNYLFSHHLLDAPIVKAANQSLDVSYRFTIWPDTSPTVTNSVLIGGVLYTCTTSFYDLADSTGTVFTSEWEPFSNTNTVYDGAPAGPLDTSPTGDAANGASAPSIFNRQTGQYDFSFFYALDRGNTTSSKITVAVFRTNNFFHIQTHFEAENGPDIGGGIPKDATKELTLVWQLSWGERP